MRRLSRLVLLAAVLGGGYLLFGDGPREVVLVYDVASVPGATDLEVELRREGQIVRRARFRLPEDGASIRHPLKLPDGDYALGWTLVSPGGSARRGERTLVVSEGGTIVIAVGG